MSFMDRLLTIFKSWVNKLLDRAEDPAEQLDYSYERQLELLQNVRRGVVDVTTAKRRIELQAAKLEQSVTKLDGQARSALQAGREDLARLALERKQLVMAQLQSVDAQRDQLQGEQDKLVLAEQRLTQKVEAFRTQKETIKAQYSAAEAQVKIGEAVTGISEEMADVGMSVERAQNKTEDMRARAGAIDELIESGALTDFTSTGDSLDRELAQLGSATQVESELDSLRRELGVGAPETAPAEEAPTELPGQGQTGTRGAGA